MAGNHPIFPTWQRLAEGLISLSSHQNNMAESRSFEEFEILRQVPRNLSVDSDYAVQRHRGDRLHTEIGALMAGCGL
jgi:hypothetical protein